MTVNSDAAAASLDRIEILPATLRDLFAIYRLEKRCFPLDSWPFADIIAALLLPRLVRFKAVDGDQVIGFVLGERDREMGWVATFGVDPAHRNRGVGTRLLEKIESSLATPKYRLCVRTSNESAIRLYRRRGYRTVDIWPAYYRGGEDALVMEKSTGA